MLLSFEQLPHTTTPLLSPRLAHWTDSRAFSQSTLYVSKYVRTLQLRISFSVVPSPSCPTFIHTPSHNETEETLKYPKCWLCNLFTSTCSTWNLCLELLIAYINVLEDRISRILAELSFNEEATWRKYRFYEDTGLGLNPKRLRKINGSCAMGGSSMNAFLVQISLPDSSEMTVANHFGF